MNKVKKQKGFTLIELLVVIAIIGILAAIVLVNVNSARNKAKDAALKANLASLPAAAELFYDNASTYVGVEADTTYGFKTAYDAAAAISAAESVVGTASGWCACAQSVTTTTNYYCLDAAGHNTTSAITCAVDCEGTDVLCTGT